MRTAAAAGLAVAAGLLCVGGCGSASSVSSQRLPPDAIPIPSGRGPAYRLPAIPRAVATGASISGLRCMRDLGSRFAVHLELYARRLVLPVPAGIGIAPPQRRHGAYVLGGRCYYALVTFEPTGVVLVDRRRPLTLRALFAVWGQQLSDRGLAGFTGRVHAFLDGARWPGRPEAMPLRYHAEIVLEVGGVVPPHRTYAFPPGL